MRKIVEQTLDPVTLRPGITVAIIHGFHLVLRQISEPLSPNQIVGKLNYQTLALDFGAHYVAYIIRQ